MRFHASFTRTLTLLAVLAASLFLLAPAQPADAQTPAESAAVNAPVGSAFSYQGRLTDNGNPANGAYDFQFILYDAATGGAQQGSTLTQEGVAVSNGLFNVQLDFGQAVFNGDARFLEVGVKAAGATGAYTVLSPRTGLTAAPYAITSAFGGRARSYPYMVHINRFALIMGNYCFGYVPGDPAITSQFPECSSLDRFIVGPKFYSPSATGHIAAANNLPISAEGGPRWGYAFSFFLTNPQGARSVQIPMSSCNDVALYVTSGLASPDRIGNNNELVYHRYPGNNDPNLNSCPCAKLDPTINIPSGSFRLTAITRGAACTSYLTIGREDNGLNVGNWIQEANLNVDWSSLRTYIGEN